MLIYLLFCANYISFFLVPPRVAPIIFVGGTSAGLPTQATCIVLDGDTPITLRWLKDGKPIISSSSGVQITQASEIASTLSIDKTSGEHSGNYTCSASNDASTTSSSTMLTINSKFYSFEYTQTSNHICFKLFIV